MNAAHELKDKLLQVLLAHSYSLLTNNSNSSIDQVSDPISFFLFIFAYFNPISNIGTTTKKLTSNYKFDWKKISRKIFPNEFSIGKEE